MRICIIAEGCYPYVMGGVSTWTQQLIANTPQHDFVLIAIGADSSLRGKYKYAFPENIVEVHEVFLDEVRLFKQHWGKRKLMNDRAWNTLDGLICGEIMNPDDLFDMMANNDMERVVDFVTSRSFFDRVGRLCKEKFPNVPFADFYWNARSMVLPLLYLLKDGILPKADLYHSVSAGYAGIVGALNAWHYSAPFIMTEHGIYTREREEEIIKSQWINPILKDIWIEFFRCISRMAYQKCDRVISLFERNRAIQIHLQCPADKTLVIPNGVRIKDFENIDYPAPDAPPTIGAVVRVVPIKDIKTLLYAFALVKKRIKNARLFIMGPTDEDPVYYRECLQIVEAISLKDVVFTGQIDVQNAMRDIHVVILSSISEGQPLSLLEAMAAKRACVATDVGSCSELLLGNDGLGPAGIIAPTMNVEAIAQALISILENPDLCRQMGQTGYQRVCKRYLLEDFLTAYHTLYQQLIPKCV